MEQGGGPTTPLTSNPTQPGTMKVDDGRNTRSKRNREKRREEEVSLEKRGRPAVETKEEDEDWKEDFKENFEAGIKAKAREYMRTKVAQCVKFPEEIHLDAKGPIVLALSPEQASKDMERNCIMGDFLGDVEGLVEEGVPQDSAKETIFNCNKFESRVHR